MNVLDSLPAVLMAIYLVGAKLSAVQLIMVVGLYLVWSSSVALVAIVYLIAFESLFEEHPAFARTQLWYFPWPEFGTALTLSGIAVCGYFVFDTRRGRLKKGLNAQ